MTPPRLLDLLTRCLDWFSLRCRSRRRKDAGRCVKGVFHRGQHRYRPLKREAAQ